jgi:hypothetical protein
MKHFACVIALALSVCTAYAQNADILWTPQPGTGNDLEYQAGSFLIDSTQALPANNRGIVVVSKYYDRPGNRVYLTNDQFDITGNFLFPSRNNNQPGVAVNAISPTKIVQSFVNGQRRYFTLGYTDNSPNVYPVNIPVQSTNTLHCLNTSMGTVWAVKLHFAALNPAPGNAVEFLRFRDMIVLADGNLLLCGYYSRNSTSIRQMLVCKVNSTNGTVIWSGIYPIAAGFANCNVDTWSAAEALNGQILITGTVDSCALGGTSVAGTKKLLVVNLLATGAFNVASWYTNTVREMAGYKIVRLPGAAGVASRFLIMGFTESGTYTAPNREILLADVNQNTGPNAMFWVGGGRTELANDFVFREMALNNYFLYVTGYTNSFGGGPDEPYFLKLKYTTAVPTLTLVEMNTYPNSNYVARYGVEIKKASQSKYAILTNTLIRVSTTQNRFYSSMLIRDSLDVTDSCIRRPVPDIRQVTPARRDIRFTEVNDLRAYPDSWLQYEVVRKFDVCGSFKVDPKTAGVTATNVDQVLRTGQGQQAQELNVVFKGMQMYPNPARNQLTINWNGSLAADATAIIEIFSPDMKRVQMTRVTNTGITQLPLETLASGLYFIRITNGDKTGVSKFMKE